MQLSMSNITLHNDNFPEIKFKLDTSRNVLKKKNCLTLSFLANKLTQKEKIKDSFKKRIPAMKINHSRKLRHVR